MADDTNAQATSQTEQNAEKKNQQLTNATNTMSDLASMLPDSGNANYMMETPDRDLPNSPTFPSLPTSISPAFYLTPTITRALQQIPAAMQLERKDRELAAAQKSNTQLRTRLSDMEDELARAQAKVKQKNIHSSACDKKIDALQKKIALRHMDANAEPQLHKSTAKPKKIYIPPTQPSGEARLNGVNHEAPLEEKEAFSIRACEQSLRRQAELEGHYMLNARSEKRRRVAKGYLWENQEPSKNNGELREELDQARAANNSNPGHVSVRPETSEGALDIVSQQDISETATSHTEADRVKDTEGEGHGATGQRINSLLSQKSSCSSDWDNVEGVDLEKEWPYAWW